MRTGAGTRVPPGRQHQPHPGPDFCCPALVLLPGKFKFPAWTLFHHLHQPRHEKVQSHSRTDLQEGGAQEAAPMLLPPLPSQKLFPEMRARLKVSEEPGSGCSATRGSALPGPERCRGATCSAGPGRVPERTEESAPSLLSGGQPSHLWPRPPCAGKGALPSRGPTRRCAGGSR